MSYIKINVQYREHKETRPQDQAPSATSLCMRVSPPLFPLTSGDHLSNSFTDADSALQKSTRERCICISAIDMIINVRT